MVLPMLVGSEFEPLSVSLCALVSRFDVVECDTMESEAGAKAL